MKSLIFLTPFRGTYSFFPKLVNPFRKTRTCFWEITYMFFKIHVRVFLSRFSPFFIICIPWQKTKKARFLEKKSLRVLQV